MEHSLSILRDRPKIPGPMIPRLTDTTSIDLSGAVLSPQATPVPSPSVATVCGDLCQAALAKSPVETWTPIVVAALGALVSLGIAWWGWQRERENRAADKTDSAAERQLAERLALTERRFQTAAAYEREVQALIASLLAVDAGREGWRDLVLGPYLQATAEMRLAFGHAVGEGLDQVDGTLRKLLAALDSLGDVPPGGSLADDLLECREAADSVRSEAKAEMFGHSKRDEQAL